MVTTLKGLSGMGCKYTTEFGMNIGVADHSVWQEYTTVSLIDFMTTNLTKIDRNILRVLHMHIRGSLCTI